MGAALTYARRYALFTLVGIFRRGRSDLISSMHPNLPVLINAQDYAVHAVSVPASKEERVNSVEDGNTDQRGTKESHLSLPISRRKAIGTRQPSRINFQIPSKNSVYSVKIATELVEIASSKRQPDSSRNKIAWQACGHPSVQVGGR